MTGNQVLAGAAVVTGGWMALEQARYLVAGLTTRNWQRVEGRVLEMRTLSGLEDQVPGGAQWYLAGVRLAYEYHVEGQRYVGRRSSWRGHWPSVTAAVRLARRYPPRQRVTVWYNPADPRQAVLEPGPGLATLAGVALGLTVVYGGLLVLLR